MKKIVKNILISSAVAGVSLLPLSNIYAATANTTINANVASVISLTSSSTVDIALTPTATGSVISSKSDTVSVSTNNATGYNLTLASSTASTDLANGGNKIAASAGTFTAPVALATNTWGYRIDNLGGFGAGPATALTNAASSTLTFAGVPASSAPQALKSTSTTANSDKTVVWYGVNVDATKPTGKYSNTVTYTAVVK